MLRSTLAALALLTVSPLAQAAEMKMDHAAPAGATGSDAAYAAAMDKMMSGMMVKPTGNADKDFVTMMLPHHQGAVDMAEVELKYGKDPQMLKLARAVVEAQGREIAEMKAWQAKHGK